MDQDIKGIRLRGPSSSGYMISSSYAREKEGVSGVLSTQHGLITAICHVARAKGGEMALVVSWHRLKPLGRLLCLASIVLLVLRFCFPLPALLASRRFLDVLTRLEQDRPPSIIMPALRKMGLLLARI